MYKIFKENLEFIQNKENEFNNNYKKLDLELYEEKLGFEPDKNMPKLDLFKKFLEKKLFQNYDIKKIDLCYKLDEIISLQKNIEELDEKIERIEFDQSIIQLNKERGIKGDKRFYYKCFLCCEESLEQIKNKKKYKEKKLNELKESSKENTSENFCGVAFITFNTIKEQEDYLNKNNKSCCSLLFDSFITLAKIYFSPFFFCFCGHLFCSCDDDNWYDEKTLNFYKRKISFERAPEPEDIIFENLRIGFKTKLIYIILVSFVSLIICFITAALNFFLYEQQLGIDMHEKKSISFHVISLLITIITAIIDLILEIVLEKLIKCQKSYTLTDFEATYSVNLSFFWFINSCLSTSYCELCFNELQQREIITNNLFTKFLFNSFITPIMWTLNVKFVYKKIKKCIIEKKDKINYNQKELNELYELQSMNIAAKYAYFIKTLLMSFFFYPVFPLGFCISFIGFIFAYWLEKFNFSKMYKKPELLDKRIADYYIIYLFMIFYAFGTGSFFFLFTYEEDNNWITIIFIICHILLFIPFQLCFKKDVLKYKESEIHKKTYDDMYLYFNNDYERANPMTRIEGEMRYLDKLEEKNKISKKEKDKIKKKIKDENQIKFYLRKQRLSRIINIKELHNLLTLDDAEQEKQKDIICNMQCKTKSGTSKKFKNKKGKAGKAKPKSFKK